MKWEAKISNPKPMDFVIEEKKLHALMDHPDSVEYRLCVFENNREVYHDHQDTLEMAKKVAQKNFKVPMNAWKQID